MEKRVVYRMKVATKPPANVNVEGRTAAKGRTPVATVLQKKVFANVVLQLMLVPYQKRLASPANASVETMRLVKVNQQNSVEIRNFLFKIRKHNTLMNRIRNSICCT